MFPQFSFQLQFSYQQHQILSIEHSLVQDWLIFVGLNREFCPEMVTEFFFKKKTETMNYTRMRIRICCIVNYTRNHEQGDQLVFLWPYSIQTKGVDIGWRLIWKKDVTESETCFIVHLLVHIFKDLFAGGRWRGILREAFQKKNCKIYDIGQISIATYPPYLIMT